MLHLKWKDAPTVRTVTCKHTNASKYLVSNVLTVGKQYDVKNETEEFILLSITLVISVATIKIISNKYNQFRLGVIASGF